MTLKDRALKLAGQVLDKEPAAAEPPPLPPEFGQFSPNRPPPPTTATRTHYLPGGGIALDGEVEAETARLEMEQRAAEARRQARDAQVDPIYERVRALEQRIAELEARLAGQPETP